MNNKNDNSNTQNTQNKSTNTAVNHVDQTQIGGCVEEEIGLSRFISQDDSQPQVSFGWDWDQIIESFLRTSIPDAVLVGLFFWGSRFFQVHTAKSDYDFFAVVQNYQQPDDISKTTYTCAATADHPEFDVAVYELDVLASHLKAHTFWVIPFVYYPPEGIVRLTEPVQKLFRGFSLRLSQLQFELSINLKHKHLLQLKSFFLQGRELKAKKRVVLVLRHMQIILEILALNGLLISPQGTESLKPVFQVNFQHPEINAIAQFLFPEDLFRGDWKSFQGYWKPKFDHFWHIITDSTSVWSQVEQVLPEKPFAVLHFLNKTFKSPLTEPRCFRENEQSLKLLSQIYAIDVFDTGTDQFFLLPTARSPRSQITEECNGLIVQCLQGKFQVMCAPLRNVPEEAAKDLSPTTFWQSAVCYALTDGPIVLLFWEGSKWQLTSPTLAQIPQDISTHFWEIWTNSEFRFPTDTNLTYTLQICSQALKKINVQRKTELRLIAIRNSSTGDVSVTANSNSFPLPLEPLIADPSSLEICQNALSNLDHFHYCGLFAFSCTTGQSLFLELPDYVQVKEILQAPVGLLQTTLLLQYLGSHSSETIFQYWPTVSQISHIKLLKAAIVSTCKEADQLVDQFKDKASFVKSFATTNYPDHLKHTTFSHFSTLRRWPTSLEMMLSSPDRKRMNDILAHLAAHLENHKTDHK